LPPRRHPRVRGPILAPIALTSAALLLAGCAATAGIHAPKPATPAPNTAAFDALPGWSTDHVADAMPALLRGCARLALTPPDQKLGGAALAPGHGGQAGDWLAVCAEARALPPDDEAAARQFLQTRFDLVPLTDSANAAGLFTGYYEPEVAGSREENRAYHVPLLTKPAGLVDQTDATGAHQTGRLQDGALVPYYTRAEIDHGALRRQRLDLIYLKSPIDLFFLQIQGAGRIDLPNGRVVRVGYAAGNGQPYVPIGRVLSGRGDLAPDDVTAGSIRAWLQQHPRAARATMELNPSYTFFREIPGLSPDEGPPGTLGVQLTPLRSIAVDPTRVPLGAPVWVDTTNPDGTTLQRLMLAQDTGSAITGGLRADIFYGWGPQAEDDAGRMQAPGRAWLLLPKPSPNS
jgi:membrane-bound lytic murein transglycosylase A